MLEAQHVAKTYGQGPAAVHAIADISFTVEHGEIVCIVGPSGCGKTTLLRLLSGLMAPTDGQAMLKGEVVDGPPRGLSMVFQDYARSLLPWMSVLDNVALPLKMHGVRKSDRKERGMTALTEVGVDGSAAMYPWQLSGGMQQRVAIARAIAYEPDVLLMDEPFASVDAQTRAELEDLVLRVRNHLGMTIVFVTHDIDESVYLGDRVLVLSKSPTVIQQVETVSLPAPRDQVTTKELPEFTALRGRVARAIRDAQRPDAAAPPRRAEAPNSSSLTTVPPAP
jgi:NitT/TauT family transport system ATP-binding protein